MPDCPPPPYVADDFISAPPPPSPAPLRHDPAQLADHGPRHRRALLESINPYSGTAVDERNVESSIFAMMRESELLAIRRAAGFNRARLDASGPDEPDNLPQYSPPPAPRRTTYILRELHPSTQPVRSASGLNALRDDGSHRPSPEDRERARLERLRNRATSVSSAPSYSGVTSQPAPTADLGTTEAGEHQRAHDRAVAAMQRAASSAIIPASVLVELDPYVLGESHRRRDSALVKTRISPRQRELERLERMRLRGRSSGAGVCA